MTSVLHSANGICSRDLCMSSCTYGKFLARSDGGATVWASILNLAAPRSDSRCSMPIWASILRLKASESWRSEFVLQKNSSESGSVCGVHGSLCLHSENFL